MLILELHDCAISENPADVLSQQLMTPFESTPAAPDGTSDQSSPPLSTCLEDLPPSVLMGLCRAGAAHRMPLTVALLSERARQQAAALDSLAWRDLVAGALALCDCVQTAADAWGVLLYCFVDWPALLSVIVPCRILIITFIAAFEVCENCAIPSIRCHVRFWQPV